MCVVDEMNAAQDDGMTRLTEIKTSQIGNKIQRI